MSELYRVPSDSSTSALFDVVFVHGLGGDMRKTWEADGTEKTFWPAWLAAELPTAAVYSLGYDASPSAWLGHAMPLVDRAKNVLARLEANGFGARPLVFVCHSLGGLLVKQLLMTGETLGDPNWQKVARATRAVLFLATPHSGSRLADYLNLLGKLARATVAIDDLRANEPHLRDLSTWYSNNAARLSIETRAYFETRDTKGLRVVDESSANPGISGVVPIAVDADHFEICKPASKDALVFKHVRKTIAELAVAMAPATPACSLPLHSADPPGSRLDEDSPFYVMREADRRVAEIAQGKPRTLVIKAPHHFGKSSLLLRFRAACIAAGKTVAYLDLKTLGVSGCTQFEDFAQAFGQALLEELGLEAQLELPLLSKASELTEFVGQKLFPQVKGQLVLIIDEADRAIGTGWQEAFYVELRGWDARRSHPGKKASWGRLGLALAIATDPRMLIENGWVSPFNITDPVILSAFSRADLDVFNRLYGVILSPSDLDRLFQLTHGHPFLTPTAFYRLAIGRLAFDALLETAGDDAVGPFREHLREVQQRLRDANLASALGNLLADGKVSDRNVFYRLEAAGLVRQNAGRLLAGNEVYERFFNVIL